MRVLGGGCGKCVVLADVKILRPAGCGVAGAVVTVPAAVAGPSVNPVSVGPAAADSADDQSGELVAVAVAVIGLGEGGDLLDGEEVRLADQWRVCDLGGDLPVLPRVRAMSRLLPGRSGALVSGCGLVVVDPLAVPDLSAGVAGVGQDRRDGSQAPCRASTVRVPAGVVLRRRGDAVGVEGPGDRGGAPSVEAAGEDPADVVGGVRVRVELVQATPQRACAVFGCGPASTSR